MKLPIKGFPSDLIACYERVGSQVTCNPPPPLVDSDIDWLCYVWKDNFKQFDIELCRAQYKPGGSKPEDCDAANGFTSYVKIVDGVTQNVIATTDYKFFCLFMKATHLAKKLNIMAKEDRIELFQAILYGR